FRCSPSFLLHYTPPSFFHFFFFYCYADHRDLHSFPTRRSSDLYLRQARGERGRKAAGRAGAARIQPPAHARHVAAPRTTWRRRRDRKSTRLNSSHRTISYAVFCLKKKKKKKNK